MEFNSYIFVFVFLPLVWIAYALVHRNVFLSNLVLFAASLVFYCYVVLWYAVPMLVSAVLDFVIGRKINDESDEAKRRRLLIISVVVNLGLMSFFKYTGWLSAHVAAVAAMLGVSMSPLIVPLPPGVSFYTFQTMSYTIDIYKKQFTPGKSFLSYLSFVTFFPQLVAGPIERAKDLLPQLSSVRKLVSPQVAAGALFLILFGLFQKVVLADNFGNLVDLVLRYFSADPKALPAGWGLIFTYAFAFQIYCDFAAYSTIARGTARLFSIELSRNFLTPYFATNPSEFWERWHITLSRWLRDYLYIPLGGNKGGGLLTARNLLITMFLGGLWHGAGVLFIVWGLYHGLLLILYRFFPIHEYLKAAFGRFGNVLATIVFFHLVCLGWIFFRATPEQFWPIVNSILALPGAVYAAFASVSTYWETVSGPLHALSLIKSSLWQFIMANRAFTYYMWGLIIFATPVLFFDYLGRRRNCEFPDLFQSMPLWIKVLVTLVLIYGIAYFGQRQANEFIYFAF